MKLIAKLEAATACVRSRVSKLVPRLGVVLGSGLGRLASFIEVDGEAPYREIEGFAVSTVDGHDGRLIIGRLEGLPVAVLAGRVHLYEGYDVQDVVFPTRVLVRLGIQDLLVTNAAGGLNPSFPVPSVMVLRDHLNLTGKNPLIGPNESSLGPRFPDMTAAYDAELRTRLFQSAEAISLHLEEGVYAGLLGPSYETPAEIKMLRTLGADAVGMSTVCEVIAARHAGVRVAGLSCITNLGAGLSANLLSHEEVKTAARVMEDRFVALVREFAARTSPLR